MKRAICGMLIGFGMVIVAFILMAPLIWLLKPVFQFLGEGLNWWMKFWGL